MTEENKTAEIVKGTLNWTGGFSFDAVSGKGHKFAFDGRGGLTPSDALILSLAGCMSIDVVSILEKKRVKLEKYTAEIEGEKTTTFPKHYKSATLTITAKGDGLDENKLGQAVELSREKYCSVLFSLRQDLEFTVKTIVED